MTELTLFHISSLICLPPVSVPVTSVTLTPVLEKLSVMNNTETNLQCTTSPASPTPLVTWYKEALGGASVQITDSIEETSGYFNNSSEANNQNNTTVADDEDLVEVTSTLTYKVDVDDHGTKIYCEASNVENMDAVKSIEIEINVLGKFSLLPTMYF